MDKRKQFFVIIGAIYFFGILFVGYGLAFAQIYSLEQKKRREKNEIL